MNTSDEQTSKGANSGLLFLFAVFNNSDAKDQKVAYSMTDLRVFKSLPATGRLVLGNLSAPSGSNQTDP